MNIHCVNPPAHYSEHYDKSELLNSSFEDLPCPVQEAWYWYAVGCYEGAGEVVARFEDGRWGSANLGHCSCFGPEDGLRELRPLWDSWAELRGHMSTECAEHDFSTIIAAIEAKKKKRYK